jgi:hypothetical protein
MAQTISLPIAGPQAPCDPFAQRLADAGPAPFDADEHATERYSKKLWELTPAELIGRRTPTTAHCFGCTASAGSGCTGALS